MPALHSLSGYHAVIFDGGIPGDDEPDLARWVRVIEPPGIGEPGAAFQLHGLAVTSSFLFGPLEAGHAVGRPPCRVDHVRVLDENAGGDLEYYDVLERITNHRDSVETPYKFGCVSLGPSKPITDDEDALVVTVRCEGVPNLYEQTLATHLSVLTPLLPRTAVTLRI